MAKSIAFTYLLWFFMGIFGVHQFYLRRDRHAFCLWATLGGLGLGWLRDIWRIPEYVADANNSADFIENLVEQMKKRNKPKVSFMRYLGQVFMGALLGHLVYFAVPTELYDSQGAVRSMAVFIASKLAVAIGVHAVGNIGRHQLGYSYCILGALLAAPITFHNPANMIFVGLVSALVANYTGRSWRRTPPSPAGLSKRLTVLLLCASVYLAMWSSALYYNATLTTDDGDTVKLRDAAYNFFQSKAWHEFTDMMCHLRDYVRTHGLWSVWTALINAIDPQGEQHAYEVLGLEKGVTQEEITSTYRKLVRQWHPDKIKDVDKRKEAQEKFVEIQNAYDTISTLKTRRFLMNKKAPQEGEHN